MDNHVSANSDGCYCDFGEVIYVSNAGNMEMKPNCTLDQTNFDPDAETNERCWGIIRCDPTLATDPASATCLPQNGRYCTVRTNVPKTQTTNITN